MQRVAETSVLIARAGGAAALVAATAWPALLVGLCWGVALSWGRIAAAPDGATPP